MSYPPTEERTATTEREKEALEADGWEFIDKFEFGGTTEFYLKRELSGIALAKHDLRESGAFSAAQIEVLSDMLDALGNTFKGVDS